MSQGSSAISVRYVAIGDSYTVGEGASSAQAWPVLLTQQLNNAGIQTDLVANPGKTGWTTQQAIDYELPVLADSQANFVTILLGVNDYVQGVSSAEFQKRYRIIVEAAIAQAGADHVVLITIPDFAVTPTGQTFGDPAESTRGITEFNNMIKAVAAERSLTVIDLFPLTQAMGQDVTLVALDGLHPSAKEYARWTEFMYPTIVQLLQVK